MKTTLTLWAMLACAQVRAWLGFAPGTAAWLWAEHVLLVLQFRREWWLIEYEWAQPVILGERRRPDRSQPVVGRRESDHGTLSPA